MCVLHISPYALLLPGVPINRAVFLVTFSWFTMPYKQHRTCPLCETATLNLSDHLSKVHGLDCQERQPYLQMASEKLVVQKHKRPIPREPIRKTTYPEFGELVVRRHKRPTLELSEPASETAYPEFGFKHPFSMLVVGPTQSGKTHFVEQMLTTPLIEFPMDKEVQVTWFYNHWHPHYQALEKDLGPQIEFEQGLPDWSETLQELNPEIHHVLVFDDLMNQAVNSPILSRLFTQGRHRNASVILLMQNMFPKGRYNTDISRNAQYLVLFRSPSDPKQFNMIADRIFAENRFNFMQVYSKATQVPYGYVLIDNHPSTAPEDQVVTDVFGTCERHPILVKESPPIKRRFSRFIQAEQSEPDESDFERKSKRAFNEMENLPFAEQLNVIATMAKKRTFR